MHNILVNVFPSVIWGLHVSWSNEIIFFLNKRFQM